MKNKESHLLSNLPAYSEEGAVHAVVEAPKVMPVWHDRVDEFESPSDLPTRLREEIEQFFLSTTFFTAKKPEISAWKGPKKASSLIKDSNKSFLRQEG
jgi:inorganic pyrophosphatase